MLSGSAAAWSRALYFARGFRSKTESFCTIFVSRLSHYTTDDEFEKVFSQFGSVEEAKLIKDRRTQRPKGFGFVTYASKAQAEKAVKSMDGRQQTQSLRTLASHLCICNFHKVWNTRLLPCLALFPTRTISWWHLEHVLIHCICTCF